jgi:hypothetical protein
MSADARISPSDFTYFKASTRISVPGSPSAIKARNRKVETDEFALKSLISKTESIIGKSSQWRERRAKSLLRTQLRGESERLPSLIMLNKGNPRPKWDNALPLICTPQALLHKTCLSSSVRRKPLSPIKAQHIQLLLPFLPPEPPQLAPDLSTKDPALQSIINMSDSKFVQTIDSPTIKDAEIKPPKIILSKKRTVSLDKSKDIAV